MMMMVFFEVAVITTIVKGIVSHVTDDLLAPAFELDQLGVLVLRRKQEINVALAIWQYIVWKNDQFL